MDIFDLSTFDLAASIKAKKYSVAEVVNAYIDKIEKIDKQFNAFKTVDREQALLRAKIVQDQIDSGKLNSLLAGVPIGIKDNISTIGMETACASKALTGYKPVFNATVIDKLENAGMIVIGKLNMDEFAMGGSSETSYFGIVRNPYDTVRVPGGSSGGSAAAVAAGLVPITLGSDTGGSIRQPCSFCGATGIKPTYGAVSRYGCVALASSLDQIGPIGKNIDDCAALLEIISGPDLKDSTCVIKEPFNFNHEIHEIHEKKFKIGLPRNYLSSGIDEDVKNAILAAAEEYKAARSTVEEFDMPLLEYFVPTYYIIMCAEASSNLSRFDGLKYGYRSPAAKNLSEVYRLSRSEGFGLEVKRRIMVGSFVLSSGYYDAYYKKALQTRTLIKNAYSNLFKQFDMILSPVAPTTAYKIGENINDPIKMYMGDIYSVSINLAGVPAVALPCGFDKQGLPVGMQLIGDAFSEPKLIEAARLFQSRTDYHKKKPPCRCAAVRDNSGANL